VGAWSADAGTGEGVADEGSHPRVLVSWNPKSGWG
jgi:hypothetical protein